MTPQLRHFLDLLGEEYLRGGASAAVWGRTTERYIAGLPFIPAATGGHAEVANATLEPVIVLNPSGEFEMLNADTAFDHHTLQRMFLNSPSFWPPIP